MLNTVNCPCERLHCFALPGIVNTAVSPTSPHLLQSVESSFEFSSFRWGEIVFWCNFNLHFSLRKTEHTYICSRAIFMFYLSVHVFCLFIFYKDFSSPTSILRVLQILCISALYLWYNYYLSNFLLVFWLCLWCFLPSCFFFPNYF